MDWMAVISVFIIFVPAAAILDMSLYLENKENLYSEALDYYLLFLVL